MNVLQGLGNALRLLISRLENSCSHRAAPAGDTAFQNRQDPGVGFFRLEATRIVDEQL